MPGWRTRVIRRAVLWGALVALMVGPAPIALRAHDTPPNEAEDWCDHYDPCYTYATACVITPTHLEHITQWPHAAVSTHECIMSAKRAHKAHWAQFYTIRTIYGHEYNIDYAEWGPVWVSAGWGAWPVNTFTDPDMDLSGWPQVVAYANAWSSAEFVKWGTADWLHQHQVFLNY